ncbi:HNH endonuclease [uncultured Bilophila sp.]|uniref:HNH endonuclease n=1 Tax=uncultured Bilophila sp. TaxID=529385 RepID=UPI00338E89B8
MIPSHLSYCNPRAATFPIDWKEAYFRIYFNHEESGYICPICKKIFRGPNGFKQLHADHIFPRSLGGETIWGNMQLLCKKCNLEKYNSIR